MNKLPDNYTLKLNAFEVGIISGIIARHGEVNVPLELRMKLKKITQQIYLDSGFSPDQVYGKEE